MTFRSNANTDSSSFASTGAPTRFDTRLVKYTRSGAPDGTLSEIFGVSSSAAVWAAADAVKREIHATAKIPSPTLIAHLCRSYHHRYGADGNQTRATTSWERSDFR